MGFLPDIKKVVAAVPAQRQSLFLSATLAPEIVTLAESILDQPERVTIAAKQTTAAGIQQGMAFLPAKQKADLLHQLLRAQLELEGLNLTLIFSRTKHGANRLAENLCKQQIPAVAIHGNKSQAARLKALDRFRSGQSPVLVATDVAARGIDVKNITLVINFDLPEEPESYVHRIGRTARAGAEGLAISFCSREEVYYLREIEKLIRKPIPAWREHPYHDEGIERLVKSNERVSKPPRGGQRGGGQRQGGRPPRSSSKPSHGKPKRHASHSGRPGGKPKPRRRRRSS